MEKLLKYNGIYGGGGIRQSNIELLRIIAMVLVMVVHADFFSLGVPTIMQLHEATLPTVTRYFIQSLSICCVNVFIIISGYFGIRPKRKSLLSLIYQILFFFGLIYVTSIAAGIAALNVQGIMQCLCLTSSSWFIKAYVLLYLIAPILNAYVDLDKHRQFKTILIGFFIFQTVYGCTNASGFFDQGYSTISFIGLYMLGRYLNIYRPKLMDYNALIYGGVYIMCAVILTLMGLVALKAGKNIEWQLYSYINPLVLLETVSLLLLCLRIRFTSRLINWMAASAFAVYLLHANPIALQKLFVPWIQAIYTELSGVTALMVIGAVLMGFFAVAVVIDQIRIFTYEFFSEKIRYRRVESRNI